MADDELVHLGVEEGVATLTLDSPHNRNALSSRLMVELAERLAAAAADPAVRAVLLTAAGPTFCAGADLAEVGAGGVDEGTRALLGLLRRVVELPKPVVAAVRGHVRAGGIGLVGACDVAMVAEDATFAFTEARLGLTPALISLTTLPRMQPRAASRAFLTGEVFDGREAARSGLVTAAVPGAELDAEIERVLAGLRAGSPQGLLETKLLLTGDLRRHLDQRGQEMTELSARLFGSEEAREGMRAFLERRPPRWA